MTILEQQQLRELAQAAPHKEWRAGNCYGKPFIADIEVLADTPDGLMVVMQGNQHFTAESVAAVAFVGAASPVTVLALLDEIDRLKHSLGVANANRDHLARELRQALGVQDRLKADNAELRKDKDRLDHGYIMTGTPGVDACEHRGTDLRAAIDRVTQLDEQRVQRQAMTKGQQP